MSLLLDQDVTLEGSHSVISLSMSLGHQTWNPKAVGRQPHSKLSMEKRQSREARQ